MTELILMRHAKTEMAGPGIADLTRALTSRGRSDAHLIGRKLASTGYLPDLILCSPATRTRQTLEAILTALPGKPATEIVPGLYGGRATDYFAVIRKFGGTAERLMLIAHNPTIHATARAAAGAGASALRERLDERFPTGAFAVIAFKTDRWADAEAGEGRLISFVRPAEIGGGPGT